MMQEGKRRLKIGIITGKKAYPLIEEVVKPIERKGKADFIIIPLDIGVVSLASADLIANKLKNSPSFLKTLKSCDLVLIPGTVKGDAEKITEITGVTTYKGGIYPSSISFIVESLLRGEELSTTDPAETFLKMKEEKMLRGTLEQIYRSYERAFSIGSIGIPIRPPPIVIAAETPVSMSPDMLEDHARMLEENGAEIVIAGLPIDESLEASMRRIQAVEKGLNRASLGVDSLNPKALIEGAKIGAELLLSLSEGNMEQLRGVRDRAFVVIPGNPMEGRLPRKGEEAANMLDVALKKAREFGFEKLIADPVLSPPGIGLSESIKAYYFSSQLLQGIPLFAGLSNVIELFDADSTGIAALLVQLLGEIGVSVMLTSEESRKAQGSTLEARGASLLSSLSLHLKAPPHNIGIDLLFMKEKETQPEMVFPEGAIIEEVKEEPQPRMDEGIFFTIGINRNDQSIIACANLSGKNICFKGKSARALYKKIVSQFESISKEHAAYLGYELSKAELSLALGKTYIQDSDLLDQLRKKRESIRGIFQHIWEVRSNG
ncbi:MAG: dihydropteroate synthase-like protein [Fervidicoccaceae archaeon]